MRKGNFASTRTTKYDITMQMSKWHENRKKLTTRRTSSIDVPESFFYLTVSSTSTLQEQRLEKKERCVDTHTHFTIDHHHQQQHKVINYVQSASDYEEKKAA